MCPRIPRPWAGTRFREFSFAETADTNGDSTANNSFGGWGSVLELAQNDPAAETDTLSLVYNGNKQRTGLDNATFLDADHIAFVEDAGDTRALGAELRVHVRPSRGLLPRGRNRCGSSPKAGPAGQSRFRLVRLQRLPPGRRPPRRTPSGLPGFLRMGPSRCPVGGRRPRQLAGTRRRRPQQPPSGYSPPPDTSC